MNKPAAFPLMDLRLQYSGIKDEIDAAIHRVMESGRFIGGEELAAFEQDFANYCDTTFCVGVGNGTDALYLALRALGVGAGDEVITVSNTFIATTEAIALCEASSVFVDIDANTLLIDPSLIEEKITNKTKAIVAVHLYGQPCDMGQLMDIAHRYSLKVIEDAAQAHGARWSGRRVGSFGNLACFSFFPGKNLGAYGDGGAVTGMDADLMSKVRMLANHGRKEKYTHEIEGVNSRLDSIQAAVLAVKLKHLDSWNDRRRSHAKLYDGLFDKADIRHVTVNSQAEAVYHQYVIMVPADDRDDIINALQGYGIAAGIHYPIPVHLQPACISYGYSIGSLPGTEKAASEIISLPVYPELDEASLRYIVSCVVDAVADPS